MKKCCIEVSHEWLKKQAKMPQEAIIVGIVKNEVSDTFRFYVHNWGNETPEGSIIEQREIFDVKEESLK